MTRNISAELISIGTEILLGEITDTNSVYMARNLRDLGINVFYMVSVGDNRERIAKTIESSLERSDIVITCGGLGPTVDDMTRQSVADATHRPLIFHPALLEAIAQRFQQFNIKMTENNQRQAYLPENAIVIENPVGTAPSFIVEIGEKCVISLPGVPREMKFLFQERVIPYLRERYNITEQIILARVLKTAGIGESMLDELIGTEILEATNPTVGLAAHNGQIDVRITAKADTRAQAEALIAPIEAEIYTRAGRFIFGKDNDRLEQVFGQLLAQHNKKLLVIESGLKGIVPESLQKAQTEQFPMEFKYFESPEALASALNLPYEHAQTPLTALANASAQALLVSTGFDICIAIVSHPHQEENSDQFGGTAIVVSDGTTTRQRQYGFGAKFNGAAQFVNNWGLAVAWYLVKESL